MKIVAAFAIVLTCASLQAAEACGANPDRSQDARRHDLQVDLLSKRIHLALFEPFAIGVWAPALESLRADRAFALRIGDTSRATDLHLMINAEKRRIRSSLEVDVAIAARRLASPSRAPRSCLYLGP